MKKLKKKKVVIADKLKPVRPNATSMLHVKKERADIVGKLKSIRPLNDTEKTRMKKTLKKIEEAEYYGGGWNRVPGGFATTKVGDSDMETIDVYLEAGVKDGKSDTVKIEVDRKTMDVIGDSRLTTNSTQITCKIVRMGGKDIQVCYHETNDKKGVEVYSGKNHIFDSKDNSSSKKYDLDETPPKYKVVVDELIETHHKRLEGGGKTSGGGEVNGFFLNNGKTFINVAVGKSSPNRKGEVVKIKEIDGVKWATVKFRDFSEDIRFEEESKSSGGLMGSDEMSEEETKQYIQNLSEEDWNRLKPENKEKYKKYRNSKASGGSMATGGGVGEIQTEKVTASSIKSKKHPFTFTFDNAYRKGDIVVQRVGGSDMWEVGIKGEPMGRVYKSAIAEMAIRKAEELEKGGSMSSGCKTGKVYYALYDTQTGRYMASGLNSTSKEELKGDLISYLSVDHSAKELKELKAQSVESLAAMYEFDIQKQDTKFPEEEYAGGGKVKHSDLIKKIDAQIKKHKADDNYDEYGEEANKIFKQFDKEVFVIDNDDDAHEYLLKATPIEAHEYLKERIQKLDGKKMASGGYADGGKMEEGKILIKLGIIEQKLNNRGVFLKDFSEDKIAANATFEGHDIEGYDYTDEKGEIHTLPKNIQELIDEYNSLSSDFITS